ncbi:PAS domain-containing sensor histidine kinase [Parabacteroides sp. Marseille-P3160]|uniref:sensor histidine kinase n=1 Tax=Parabacteroides sp. Marseille-P3160 TaxID=1917887 RepID=UPI0009BB5538|nr:ATP-binding protein [Parabacteroides sp. Marseille-P3160]
MPVKLTNSFSFHLLLVLALTAGLTWSVCVRAWIPAAILFLADLYAVFRLFRFYRQYTRKISYLFDAIENGDSAFQYAVDKLPSASDRITIQSLNRIIRILSDAKADIVQREKYYELILNSVNTGILVTDDNGYVYQVNNEAMHLLGLNIFTHVKQLSRIDKKLEMLIENIQPGEKRQVSFSHERGTANLSVRASGMTLQQKHVRIIAINDINRELDYKEIDSWIRLTRVLTHEIMNSITPVTSLSETLLFRYADVNSEVREGLEVIHSTGQGLISFVDSYRRFTHIPTPEPSLFYVHKLIEQAVTLVRADRKHPNISISTVIEPEDLIIHADEKLIYQVIINLLNNAMQAIGDQPDGAICIHAYCNEEETVLIEISNNGPAISPKEAEEIFIPFFTTKKGGSGIGLSISRQIMNLSGGSLTLQNNKEEPLTTFVLAFND